MSFLKIDNLSVNYRMRKETVYAVKNINFDVKKGEILGLVGESGSGKSTLGNAIINLIDEPGKISNGKVVLDGINIYENLIINMPNQRVDMYLTSGIILVITEHTVICWVCLIHLLLWTMLITEKIFEL